LYNRWLAPIHDSTNLPVRESIMNEVERETIHNVTVALRFLLKETIGDVRDDLTIQINALYGLIDKGANHDNGQ